MSGKASTIESLLKCSICLADFTDPRILPCLHTLCRGCLESHVSASGQGHKFSCPSCLHECQIPKGGLSTVPKNFFVNSFKKMLREKLKSATGEDDNTCKSAPRKCDNDDDSTAPHGKVTVYCVECAEFYCKSCESSHKMFRATRGHQMRANEVDDSDEVDDVDEIDDTTTAATEHETRTCDQHPTQNLNIYCDTCHVTICTSCHWLTHKEHGCRDLMKAAKAFSEKLTDLKKATAEHALKLTQQLKELQSSERDIQKDVDKAHQEVDLTADEMVDLVNKRRRYLHKQIDDFQKPALAEVRAACQETELNKASIEALQFYIQALQATGDITDQVVHTRGLQIQVQQQQTLPLREVTWTANFKNESNRAAALDEMLGTVDVNHFAGTTSSAGSVDTGQVKLGDAVQTLNHTFDADVEGVVVAENVLCAVGCQKNYLWLHDTRSGLERKHTITGLSPAGMAALETITGHATLVVTDYGKKIHFVTIDVHQMEIVKRRYISISFKPGHVKADLKTRRLIIVNRTDKHLMITDNNYNIQSRVTVQTDLFGMWCGVASQGLYAVLDCFLSAILWVDDQGRVKHEYGQGLRKPDDMLSDSQGRLVVADKENHRLHLIDAHKQLSCYLLTQADGIRYPTAVCLDESTSKLYVACQTGDGHRVIKVYQGPLTAPPVRTAAPSTRHSLRVKLNKYK